MSGERMEFGVPRSTCGCEGCVLNCRFMPGFLIPADLDRMLAEFPPDEWLRWAEGNLLASPGAIAMNTKTGQTFRIGTLVPAVKPDWSCIHLTADNCCDIWANAPFGCAFFSCGQEPQGLTHKGLMQVIDGHAPGHWYGRIWRHLDFIGKRQRPPEELRNRMLQQIGMAPR